MPGSKLTRFEHYQSIADQTGEPVKELDGPEIPQIVEHVFGWFLELHSARQGPLSYGEIKAWSELTGKRPTAFEVDLIKRIDVEFLTQQDARRSKPTDRN